MTFSDKGGGGYANFRFLTDKGGRVGLHPLFLTDIICEQPLVQLMQNKMLWNKGTIRSTQILDTDFLLQNICQSIE